MKKKIMIVFVIVICIIGGVLIDLLCHYQKTSSTRLVSHYDMSIKLYSRKDQDHDGIDDQSDILEGALNYIATLPKYKSRYYQGGYPNDGYGVCSDVVAQALKNAGYDLRELVDEDIRHHLEDYDIEYPDSNIDFRRVRNLKVYFSHTAISLTTDVMQIDQWQGGDIVIFESHIGIISDRRNQNGVPYVIHHNSPWQRTYEEDILEKRNDIVAHYRISE